MKRPVFALLLAVLLLCQASPAFAATNTLPANNVENSYIANLTVKENLPYSYTEPISGGFFKVRSSENSLWGVIDCYGNEIISPANGYDEIKTASNGVIIVGRKTAGEPGWPEMVYGVVDASGNLIAPLKYSSISDFADGQAAVSVTYNVKVERDDSSAPLIITTISSDSACGFIDNTGREVIPLIYHDISGSDIKLPSENPTWGGRTTGFSEGLAVVKKEQDGKWGVIDTSGNTVIDFKFAADSLSSFHSGLAKFTRNGKCGFINTKGEIVIPATYTYVSDFWDGYAVVTSSDFSRYGLINTSGKQVLPMTYSYIDYASEGMYLVKTPDEKYGYFNTTAGKITVPTIYDKHEDYYDGLAKVGVRDARFNGTGVDHHVYGYVDKQGNEVIPLKYDYVRNFSNGVARVAINRTEYVEGMLSSAERDAITAVFGGKEPEYFFINTKGERLSTPYFEADWSGRVGIVRKNGQYSLIRNPFYSEIASPTRSTVLVNGKEVAFDAYNINNSNYFKLRDLAYVLSGTGKQFEVAWDGAKNAINMVSRKSYTVAGGEMEMGDGTKKSTRLNTSTIYLDGTPVYLQAYNINGCNYFKLRDIGTTFDFDVTWDGTRNTILIDTTKSYTPD